MSVRGKIEAVIYAAEEPVTLAQLTALFGEEALFEREAARGAVSPDDEESGDTVGDGDEAAEQLLLTDAPEASALATDVSGKNVPKSVADQGGKEGTDGSAAAEKIVETSGLEPIAQNNADAVAPDADAEKRARRLWERQQREAVRAELTALMAEYDAGDRGMEIREIAGGYRVATKPEYHDAVRAFAKSLKPVMKLTLQALETLAVIAYKQPVTAPEVSEIRGVDSGGVMGSLISRKLVTTAGRKQVLGRPILYKTTKEFLLRFGLKDLAELPSMEEFEKMAGELQALGDEPDGSMPGDDGSDAAETQLSDERRGAPGSMNEPGDEFEDGNAGLEVPQEPALSVIVVEDAAEAEPGMQVEEGGAAVSDAAESESDHG